MARTAIRYVGGPTAVIDIAGVRLLTDPTFDGPGDFPVGNRTLTKTAGPAVAADGIGPVDAVLLSHDQHPDNLDTSGRACLSRAPLVLSTASAAARLGEPVRALADGDHVDLSRPGGGTLRITGVPALHGPEGSEPLVGEVTGFLLTGEGLPSVYVSGDNASLEVVSAIADRFGPVEIAVLFAGAASTPLIPDAYLTLTSDDTVEAARILGARRVVPLHFEHWDHFTQGQRTLEDAFQRAGADELLRLPVPGEWVVM